MAVPQMATFATGSVPQLPDNRPFVHGNRNNGEGTGTIVNLSINAPKELNASELRKRLDKH